eukprot:9429522-Lingulodinium_polyedra.AAC.2
MREWFQRLERLMDWRARGFLTDAECAAAKAKLGLSAERSARRSLGAAHCTYHQATNVLRAGRRALAMGIGWHSEDESETRVARGMPVLHSLCLQRPRVWQ